MALSREQVIEYVAKGRAEFAAERFTYSWVMTRTNGAVSQGASGLIEIWFRGELWATKYFTERRRRNEWVRQKIDLLRNLKGEKYILWKPD